MSKFLFFALLLQLGAGASYAQSRLTGTVISANDSTAIPACNISLIQNDSIVKSTVSDSNGMFEIDSIANGGYVIEADIFGYTTHKAQVAVTGNLALTLALKPRATTELGEVVVTADRSHTVTRTADGQIFYLSETAKKQHNPFKALQEIPLLISDPSRSTVSTIDGNSPLILIDGNRVNSGISPISPADIQSVEVITNPSARYIKDGIKSIINIKLKRKNHPYIWYELATRHDIPLCNGFGVGYFEVGNPKYSLYGRSSVSYIYHNDIDSDISRSDTGYKQSFSQRNLQDKRGWLGELLFKGNPSQNDYLAAHAFVSTGHTKNRQYGEGIIETEMPRTYMFNGRNLDKSVIVTSSGYYKHSFAKGNELEARIAYNYNKNDYSSDRADTFDDDTNDIIASQLFHNHRHSASLQIDYQNEYSETGVFTAGAHTSLQIDRIEHTHEPYSLFRHNDVNQYIYAGWVNKFFDCLWFNASAGIEGVWLKAGTHSNHYFRPSAAAGLTWVINSNNSLELEYQLTNNSPEVNELNPFNTSTDMMVQTVGNPYLRPQYMQYIPLSYTFNIKGLYLRPSVYYKRITDMISPTGYTNDEGIFISTYENHGRFTQICAVMNASYRLKNGGVYGMAGWYGNYFKEQTAHSAFTSQFGFYYYLNKFSFYGNVSYDNRKVSKMSVTRYYRPSTAELQVNYNFMPDFYIGACLTHATGEFHTRTVTRSGNYMEISNVRYRDSNLRPWIILRYTFRRNSDRKIKLNKVLNSQEKGISLGK